MDQYNATTPPEITVIIKPWKGPVSDTSQTIVLVFHAFEPVVWKVYSEHFPVGTKFIIKVRTAERKAWICKILGP